MSELQLLKEKVHLLLEETSSEELIYAVYKQLQEGVASKPDEISTSEKERLKEAWEDVTAGRMTPAEEVYTRLQSQYQQNQMPGIELKG